VVEGTRYDLVVAPHATDTGQSVSAEIGEHVVA